MTKQEAQIADQTAQQMVSELTSIASGVSGLFQKESEARLNTKKAKEVAAPFYKDARIASATLKASIKETLGKIESTEAPFREKGQVAAKDYMDKAAQARADVKSIREDLQARLASALVKQILGVQ